MAVWGQDGLCPPAPGPGRNLRMPNAGGVWGPGVLLPDAPPCFPGETWGDPPRPRVSQDGARRVPATGLASLDQDLTHSQDSVTADPSAALSRSTAKCRAPLCASCACAASAAGPGNAFCPPRAGLVPSADDRAGPVAGPARARVGLHAPGAFLLCVDVCARLCSHTGF